MTLIVTIIALVCERLLSHLRRWRSYAWFDRYLSQVQRAGIAGHVWQSAWGLLLLAPPLILIALLQWWLQGGVLGLLGLVFGVLVLVFSLGPRDLWEEGHKLIEARNAGRHDQANAIAGDLTAVAGAQAPARPDEATLVRATLLQAHERVLGVLFWFFLLGPLGAAGYRLIADMPRHLAGRPDGNALLEAAARLHAIAAWIPLRVSAVLYGLAGSTEGALAGWRDAGSGDDDWARRGWRLLTETGCGALRIEAGPDRHRVAPDLSDALSLAWRSLIILLAVLAALTIAGWFV